MQPRQMIQRLMNNISTVIVGKQEVIEYALIALLCRGHVLIEDVPGVGKTTLASALAKSLDCTFRRIQFTPDLMPSDVTGYTLVNFKTGETEYREGSVMSQVVLADEINRTSPKTQSALLEVMEEQQVTVDGVTHPVPQPFIVLATQNPIEQEGTYPLPEAQLDRFMFGLSVEYPSFEEEVRVIRETTSEKHFHLEKVVTAEEICAMQEAIRWIPVPESVAVRIAGIVRATRPGTENKLASRYFRWGAGPRAGQFLALAGKAFAAFEGRSNVSEEHVLRALEPVLRHRLVFNYRAESEHVALADVLDELIRSVR